MSFCVKCGYKIADQFKFCPMCGTVKLSIPQQPIYNEQPVKDENIQQPIYSEQPVKEENIQQPIYNEQPVKEENIQQPIYSEQLVKEENIQQPLCTGQYAATNNIEKTTFVKLFSLISKISIATLSFIMLILVLFAPVIEAPVDDEILEDAGISFSEEVHIKLTGIDIIKYGFLSLSDYTDDEAQRDYKEIHSELYKKQTELMFKNISAHDLEEMANIIEPYRNALIDSYEDNDEIILVDNTFLEIEFVLGSLVIIAVIVLLTIATIFSILSIFKKDYTYKKSVKLWSISMSLLFLFVGALVISGIGMDNRICPAIGSSVAGGALITCLIFVIIMISLIYLHELFNKNIKFNLFKVIGRCVALVLLVISLFVFNGVFMKVKVDGEVYTTLKPTIQTQVQSIELIDNYYIDGNYLLLPNASNVLDEFSDANPTEQHDYEVLLNNFYVTSQVSGKTNSESMFVIIYAFYFIISVLLSFSFYLIVQGLVENFDSTKYSTNMIVSILMIMFVITINIILCSSFNSIIEVINTKALDFSIAINPFVVIALLLIALVSSLILIKKGTANDNKQFDAE